MCALRIILRIIGCCIRDRLLLRSSKIRFSDLIPALLQNILSKSN